MNEGTSPNGATRKLVLLVLLAVAACVFAAGIDWGLPSRDSDRVLLGKDLSGLRLEPLTEKLPAVDTSRGADVVTPTGPADAVVPLNDNDLKRAQILCRYRLYSEQPDEMVTFRALSGMNPSQLKLDPGLYQYGGLWIYSVGAVLQGGNVLGLIDLAGGRSLYIGNPPVFAKFYTAARAFSAAWGLVGVLAVFVIARRLACGLLLPAMATLCFVVMPVTINMAHEAKPHLPGAVLVLLAVVAASSYVRHGTFKWAVLTGLACGAAAGMVLSGVVAFLVLPTMALLRRGPIKGRLASLLLAAVVGVLVYCLTNPFVVYHLAHDRAVLKANLGNTTAMYRFNLSPAGVLDAVRLMAVGTSPLLWVAGLIGTGILMTTGAARMAHRPRDAAETPDDFHPWKVGVLLAVVAVGGVLEFLPTAAGKPGEYGRFFLLPDAALAIAAVASLGRLRVGEQIKADAAILLVAVTGFYGAFYLAGFVKDAMPGVATSRQVEARRLQQLLDSRQAEYAKRVLKGKAPPNAPPQHRPAPAIHRPVLGVYADPAPYVLPPVDLTGWDIVRLPRGFDAAKGPAVADVIVRPDERVDLLDPRSTPISWADKRFDVTERPVGDRLAYMQAGATAP